jgi:hypothetical protein
VRGTVVVTGVSEFQFLVFSEPLKKKGGAADPPHTRPEHSLVNIMEKLTHQFCESMRWAES